MKEKLIIAAFAIALVAAAYAFDAGFCLTVAMLALAGMNNA